MIRTLLLYSFIACFVGQGSLHGDELFQSSNRKLKASQKDYIEDRLKGLRDSDYKKRFGVVQYLIGLQRTALPFLAEEVEDGTNPMSVRCVLMTLAEIGGPEAVRLLQQALADSDFGRDERVIAALGLGKQGGSLDLVALRSMLQSGENRYVRKAAALGLARMQDLTSVSRLLKLAREEREEELVSVFLLAALMIGGEEVIKEMPRLFARFKDYQRVLLLGSAFLGDPVLLPTLMKFGAGNEEKRNALALTLGRFRSNEAVVFLEKIAVGADPGAAADALYSLTFQDQEKSAGVFARVLDGPALPYVKAQALLALAASGRINHFVQRVYGMLKNPDETLRSAAVLALRHSQDRESPIRLAEILAFEKRPAVVSDLLMSLGLLGGVQYLKDAEEWAKKSKFPETARLAELVVKVIRGKTDIRMLEEVYEKRIQALSARWSLRFRNRIMEEVFKVLELDRIVRKTAPGVGGGDEGGGSGADTGAGGEEGSSDGGGEEGASGAGDEVAPPLGRYQGDGSPKKKFQYRHEVLEWDLLQWFTYYPYFPERFFSESRR